MSSDRPDDPKTETPPAAHEGLESALDALMPSIAPDTRPTSSTPASTATEVLDAPPAQPLAAESVPPTDTSSRGDTARPGLLSAVLSRPETTFDHGAETAYRSIPRRRWPELEPTFLVSGREGERARAHGLEHLAERASGTVRGELLAAAAEHWQRAGELSRGRELCERALAERDDDLLALRELRKLALLERDLERARTLLLRELEIAVAGEERALLRLSLAELELQRGDMVAAEKAAKESLSEKPSVSAALFLYELYARTARAKEGADALQQAAKLWPEPKAQAALMLEAGRLCRSAGEPQAALTLFERAQALDPDLVDAALSGYRAAREAGDVRAALLVLERLERSLDGHKLAVDLQRTRARLLEARGSTEEALRCVSAADSRVGHRMQARLAERLGNRTLQRTALAAYTDASGGSERALGQLGLAELSLAEGAFEAASDALRQAAALDGRLSLVRTMQSAFARTSGAAASFAPRAEDSAEGDLLEAAARLAPDAKNGVRELELLAKAASQSRTAGQLWLDLAIELGLWSDVATGLAREAEQIAPAERLGVELALCDVRETHALGETTTLSAREAAPFGVLLVLLHRIHRSREPQVRGALWLELSAQLRGEAAASAATLAGDYLGQAGGAREAYERALAAAPGYAPSCWALEPILLARDDGPALERVQAALSRASDDPLERAARLIRLAALTPANTQEEARSRMREAAALAPSEALLWDRGRSGSEERASLTLAELLEDGGHSASGPLSVMAKLRAAALYEDAGEPARAAVLYREVLDRSHGANAHASLGLERALARAGLVTLLFERLNRVVKEADSAANHGDALERLALVRLGAGDDRHAIAAWHALLDVDGERVGALRAVQRNAMERGDLAQLALTAERLARRNHDPKERAAQLRLLVRTRELEGHAGPALIDTDAGLGLFYALWLERAAHAHGDSLALADAVLWSAAEHITDPSERASYAMRAAEALESVSATRAAQALEPYAAAAPEHTLVHELLGRLRHAAGDPSGAAHAYEQTALASPSPLRAARNFYRAAVLWQDAVGDDREARRLLEAVVAVDVLHRDAFQRLKALLAGDKDAAALCRLLERRIAEGGEPALLSDLHLERSRLLMRLGQKASAKTALRAALELDGERLEALRAVAELHLQSAEWREAAEALIRVARLTQDPTVLRETFMSLGLIYTDHLPDLRRAEIAYSRAVALDPNDRSAVERLLAVFRKSRDHDKALRACDRLLDLARDEVELDQRTVELASVLEDKGELLRAERALNQRREQRPDSGAIIVALSELYARQRDQKALAVHLDRSVHALRSGILRDPTEPERYSALCDTLARRGRAKAAACVAAFAQDLGFEDARIERVAKDFQALQGAALSPTVIEHLWPDSLDETARELLAWLEPRAGALLPSSADHEQLKQAPAELKHALEVAQGYIDLHRVVLFAVPGQELLPVHGKPLGLLIGRELLASCDADELTFLLLRAATIASLHLTAAVRAEPAELDALFTAAAADEEGSTDPIRQRIAQSLSQKQRRELQQLMKAVRARGPLNAARLRALTLETGSRLALATLANPSAAFAALAACATLGPAASYEGHDLSTALSRSHEARALFSFALSDAHIELRSQLDSQTQK